MMRGALWLPKPLSSLAAMRRTIDVSLSLYKEWAGPNDGHCDPHRTHDPFLPPVVSER
jgi:hypothetical protein